MPNGHHTFLVPEIDHSKIGKFWIPWPDGEGSLSQQGGIVEILANALSLTMWEKIVQKMSTMFLHKDFAAAKLDGVGTFNRRPRCLPAATFSAFELAVDNIDISKEASRKRREERGRPICYSEVY